MRSYDDRLYPVTSALTALNVIVFFIGVIVPSLGERIYDAGILSSTAVLDGGDGGG